MLARALYLPKEWASDADRREESGVPEEIGFATKIVLSRRMIDRAVESGVPARWVTADAVYGPDYQFRTAAEGHGLGYVVGVRTDFAVWAGFRQVRVGALLAGTPADSWHRLSCGAGSKGPRVYDWALSRVSAPEPDQYARWVLIRRSVSDPDEVAYFACGGPPRCSARWSASRGRAGRLRTCSSWPRATAGWTSTRCRAGPAGTGTSPSACGRWRSWR